MQLKNEKITVEAGEGQMMTIESEEVLQKEPVFQSVRFRAFIAAVLFQLLIMAVGWLGVETDPDTLIFLQNVADSITALVIGLIVGRSFRNTAV